MTDMSIREIHAWCWKAIKTVRSLLAWCRQWSAPAAYKSAEQDPLLRLRGSGRQLWATEHADEYVRRLRGGGSGLS